MIQDISPKKYKLDYKIACPKDGDRVFAFRGSKKREDRALVKFDADGRALVPTFRELKASGLGDPG